MRHANGTGEKRRWEEKLLGRPAAEIQTLSSEQIRDLIHEVEVHQIELEMQNDELRHTQEELETTRDRYAELYDFAPVGYFTLSDKGLILEANLTGAALLGATKSYLKQKPLSRYIAAGDLKIYYQHLNQSFAEQGLQSCDLQISRSDGMRFFARLQSRRVANADGTAEQIRTVITDVSERERIEQALLEEKERAQVTLKCIGEAVIAMDAGGMIQYLNPVAELLTGWALPEACAKPLDQVFCLGDESNQDFPLDLVAECLEKNAAVRRANHFVLRHRSKLEYLIEATAAPIRRRDGETLGVVLVFRDVTESRRMVQQMAHDAAHDPLTGLKNRREFETRLERALGSSKIHGASHVLCYLDLDQFKIVNDTAGHTAGDALLKQLTALIRARIRDRDTLARLGGDEFGLLLDNCPLDIGVEIAQTLVATVREFRFAWDRHVFQLGVSVGLVPVTARSTSVSELLSQVDVACYTAKDLGRSQVYVYQLEDGETVRRHTEILCVAELRDALEQGRFCLYCQPIMSLASDAGPTDHYELLLRMRDVQGELLLPGTFIPAAERYGLMAAIDRWVISTTLQPGSEVFASIPNALVAINLSGNSLSDGSLTEFVQQQLADSALEPRQICFEITETAAIHNLCHATRIIADLRECGCRFALDDFGSGLSSFTYLKQLPVDYLKIDGSFVRDMAEDPVDHAMVTAINQIGHTMNIQTIAEWAESQAVIEELRALGVDFVQGYAVGAPTRLALPCTNAGSLSGTGRK